MEIVTKYPVKEAIELQNWPLQTHYLLLHQDSLFYLSKINLSLLRLHKHINQLRQLK
jgi:hypothetical protein